MNPLKIVYFLLGTLSLCVGVVGIVVPGLPTTPFLLITAGLYIKSSNRLYHQLLKNRIVGSYILNYQKNKGLTAKAKCYSIVIMCLMISISCTLLVKVLVGKIIIMILGLVGICVMTFIIPTIKDNND